MNVAETLRAIAESYGAHRLTPEDVDACESGARCYEIVARLAALEPAAFHYRDVDPLVEQARALVTGQEGS